MFLLLVLSALCTVCCTYTMDDNYLRGVDKAAELQRLQQQKSLPVVQVTPAIDNPAPPKPPRTGALTSMFPTLKLGQRVHQASSPVKSMSMVSNDNAVPLYTLTNRTAILASPVLDNGNEITFSGASVLLPLKNSLCVAGSHEQLIVHDTSDGVHTKNITLPMAQGEYITSFRSAPAQQDAYYTHPTPCAMVANRRDSVIYVAKKYRQRSLLEAYLLTGSTAASLECKTTHSIKLDATPPGRARVSQMGTVALSYVPYRGVASLSSAAITIWDDSTHQQKHTIKMSDRYNGRTSLLNMAVLDPNVLLFTSPCRRAEDEGDENSFQNVEMCDLRDEKNIEVVARFEPARNAITALGVSPNAHCFLAAPPTTLAGPMFEWDLRKNAPVHTFNIHGIQLSTVDAFATHENKILATTDGRGGVCMHVWDINAANSVPDHIERPKQSIKISDVNASYAPSIHVHKDGTCFAVHNNEIIRLDKVAATRVHHDADNA